jgi:NitT/TauT family transport system ATP-binding protein
VRTGGTILFVTHDLSEAVRLADRIVVLDGRPARLARDLHVGLTAAQRRDPEAVARVRARLGPEEAAAGPGARPPARATGSAR